MLTLGISHDTVRNYFERSRQTEAGWIRAHHGHNYSLTYIFLSGNMGHTALLHLHSQEKEPEFTYTNM